MWRVIACAALLVTLLAAAPARGEDDVPPALLNLRAGAALPLSRATTQFSISPELAFRLGDTTGYVTFGPTFQYGYFPTVIIPIGVQYDLVLARGFSIYPKVEAGVAVLYSFGLPDPTVGFAVTPTAGIRYHVNKMFHIGAEPFGLTTIVDAVAIHLQARVYGYFWFDL
jgi:hypothetical protein